MLGLKSSALDAIDGVSHRFFTAIGGTSPSPWRGLNTSYDVGDAPARVDENLARVRFQLGVRKRSLLTATQVHKDDVVVVDALSDLDTIASQKADALMTTAEEVGVGVRTADCAPILLAAKDGRAVAAAHAGWRGATGGIIEATLQTLDAARVPAAEVVAAIGPCIGFDAFEVGPEVIDAAKARVSIDGLTKAGAGDRHFFDLAGFCERLLLNAGVPTVDVIRSCTVSDPEQYFSYRASNGRCGRMMSAIARTQPPKENG